MPLNGSYSRFLNGVRSYLGKALFNVEMAVILAILFHNPIAVRLHGRVRKAGKRQITGLGLL
jgi:hypothetical protein